MLFKPTKLHVITDKYIIVHDAQIRASVSQPFWVSSIEGVQAAVRRYGTGVRCREKWRDEWRATSQPATLPAILTIIITNAKFLQLTEIFICSVTIIRLEVVFPYE